MSFLRGAISIVSVGKISSLRMSDCTAWELSHSCKRTFKSNFTCVALLIASLRPSNSTYLSNTDFCIE